MSSYWSKYPEIEHNIIEVETLIKNRVHVRNPEIEEAIISLNRSGGKKLRPAFFFFFSKFGDNNKDQDHSKLVKIAASLEILHMATLIHDDVIDDSPLRRGQKTVQTQFGKDIAVYTGDLLFTIFFELILEATNDFEYMAINSKAMKKILLGELDQMHLYHNQNQTIRDYLRAISGKTAELFKLSAREGAHFGGANQEIVRLSGKIGYYIGMAFQILDDILDYTADEKELNKPVLEDLDKGVYSLPLLLAMKKEPELFKAILNKKEKITKEDKQKVAQMVISQDGVEIARDIAKRYTQKAISAIQELPKSKNQKQLLQLTKQLLKRTI